MEEAIIRTENISRVFQNGNNQVVALDHVNIEIMPRRLTILNGKSGSGKTTLINLLVGLDKPSEGKIFFHGQETTAISESKRDNLRRTEMGIVFQSIALMGHMSALENVEFGLSVAGYPSKERTARALECLEFVGLSKRARHIPQEMSGGEQQRVAIARAIAHRPLVLFADEPTAQLDTAMGLQVIRVFKNLIREQNATIVMTTHDPDLMEIADRVYTLQDGKIIV